MSTVIQFPRTPQSPEPAPVDIEADLHETRTATAYAIHKGMVKSYEFDIGDDLHPYANTVEGRRCPVCDGFFPLRGRARAIRGPVDDQWRPMHEVCWIGAYLWLPR